jgi:hypothetical protein
VTDDIDEDDVPLQDKLPGRLLSALLSALLRGLVLLMTLLLLWWCAHLLGSP